MLNEQELNKLAQMIPAKTRYAVIASWADVEETAEEWDDFEHVDYRNRWEDACDCKRRIEADGLMAYIVEPAQPLHFVVYYAKQGRDSRGGTRGPQDVSLSETFADIESARKECERLFEYEKDELRICLHRNAKEHRYDVAFAYVAAEWSDGEDAWDALSRADKDAVNAASFECSGQDIIDEDNSDNDED